MIEDTCLIFETGRPQRQKGVQARGYISWSNLVETKSHLISPLFIFGNTTTICISLPFEHERNHPQICRFIQIFRSKPSSASASRAATIPAIGYSCFAAKTLSLVLGTIPLADRLRVFLIRSRFKAANVSIVMESRRHSHSASCLHPTSTKSSRQHSAPHRSAAKRTLWSWSLT
jgi:hypothetical protein